MSDKELSLKEIQYKELKLLKKFDEICKKNNIEYSLAGGSMLGAVRHHGMIPWDDDVDVYLKRPDYEKLMSIEYRDDCYEIKSYRYTKNYYYPFAKLVDKTTSICEDWRAEKGMGLFLDIFPVDCFDIKAPEEEHEKILYDITEKSDRWIMLAYLLGHKLSHHREFSPRYFAKLALKTATLPFRKAIIRHADMRISKCKGGNYYGCLIQHAQKIPFVPAKAFDGIVYMEFDGLKAPVYAGYDEILTQQYGDYMTPPPEDKRTSGHWFKVYKNDEV